MMADNRFNIDSPNKAEALARALFLAERRWVDTGYHQVVWTNGYTFMYRNAGDGPQDHEFEEEGYTWAKFLEIPSEDETGSG